MDGWTPMLSRADLENQLFLLRSGSTRPWTQRRDSLWWGRTYTPPRLVLSMSAWIIWSNTKRKWNESRFRPGVSKLRKGIGLSSEVGKREFTTVFLIAGCIGSLGYWQSLATRESKTQHQWYCIPKESQVPIHYDLRHHNLCMTERMVH